MLDLSCFSDLHVRVESSAHEAGEGSTEDVIGGAMCAGDETTATGTIRGGQLCNIVAHLDGLFPCPPLLSRVIFWITPTPIMFH